jgi:cystine transport system substrate-binding protein
MSDLASGRIDAALNDSLMSAYLLKMSRLPIAGRCASGRGRRMGIPFRKGNPAVQAGAEQGIGRRGRRRQPEAISLKWFGTDVSKAP